MSSDQEVSKNPPRAQVALLSTPFRIAAERSTGGSPNRFSQIPIDRDSGVFKEPIHEIFSSTGTCYQFGKDRRGHSYISLLKG